MSIKVGIGCTTYNRPACKAKWVEKLLEHTFDIEVEEKPIEGEDSLVDRITTTKPKEPYEITVKIAVDTDEDRKGVASRKNECLRALKDCDYVFLFDDDCYPIKDGWITQFIHWSESCHEEHLLYLNESHQIKSVGNFRNEYSQCGGVFMFMTKNVVERVGAFNEKFKIWGFEHAEYSQRIKMCKGVCQTGAYISMHLTSEFIYAEDYSNPDHKSSITDEEKKAHTRVNWDKFFKEPIKNIYIPL